MTSLGPRYSLLSIFLLTALVAVGLLMYQRHLKWQAVEQQFAEIIRNPNPQPEDKEIAKLLVTRYPRLAQRKGALCWVVFNCDEHLCQHFLDAGASPNDTDSYSIPCLEFAVSRRKPAVVHLLLSAGAAKVKGTKLPLGHDTGDSLLHDAASGGPVEICTALIEYGYDINALNLKGNTPVHSAVCSLNPATLECLLSHGAAVIPNRQGFTARDYVLSFQSRAPANGSRDDVLTEIMSLLDRYDPPESKNPLPEDTQ